jgi:hypothetical protein
VALADILARVRSQVAGAAGVSAAQCHLGIRWADDEATFRALFRDAGNSRLHGWMVTRRSTDEEIEGLRNLTRRHHRIEVVGLYSVDDSGAGTTMPSESEFTTVVEAVMTALRTDITLNGTAENSGPPDLLAFEHRVVRGVLCHYATIELEATERTTYA